MSLIQELVVHFRIGLHDLLRIIATAPARYKQYTIPKRRGGVRIIAQPSREVKALQHYILENKLSAFPLHGSATGYIKQRNILQNAEAHRHSRVILKLDFVDFSPSITVRDWSVLLASHRPSIIEKADSVLYRQLLFWGQVSTVPKCLSIGAPTSPALSNIILFQLDMKLFRAASRANVIYTRYADDITVSGRRIEDVLQFEASFLRIIKSTKSPSLTANNEKRGVYLRGQKRMVTGLIITPDGSISIGRERKRLISVMIHKVLVGEVSGEQMSYLKGMCGFCIANEPEFISRMRTKYGSRVIDEILAFTPRPRVARR